MILTLNMLLILLCKADDILIHSIKCGENAGQKHAAQDTMQMATTDTEPT